MDKLLAFSILSASPADISARAGGRWTRLSWRGGADEQGQGQAQQQQQRDREEKPAGSPPRPHGSSGGGKASLPRFAPEFDGIDCFETIVSH
ncbi:hypothetical protein PAHAL_4G338100 [Panicum hallii]|jgi:hypothetical protein|uniref:Uncharacterized protein n=1 Tax=Panicum hallii TaxID=206008 RepID=A0A2S3HM15_9POAL|nr:uncharacterized protein LOC112891002 [Panicum hallii]PAN25972.1 hypothetical protein PAHAL_4G338100 [Panicum hallii]